MFSFVAWVIPYKLLLESVKFTPATVRVNRVLFSFPIVTVSTTVRVHYGSFRKNFNPKVFHQQSRQSDK